MSRYIDADALFTTMKQEWLDDNGIVDVLCVIDAAPTVDAVPVVRCKDCKYRPYWDEKTSSAMFPIHDRCPCECDDYFYSWVPNDNWFCADGERRSNGEQ